MTRRSLLIGLITVGGAILALLFFQGGYESIVARLLFDVLLLAIGFAVVGRIRPAPTVVRETWRFVLGLPLAVLTLLIRTGIYLLTVDSAADTVPTLWMLLSRLPHAFSLAWIILSLIRLGGGSWQRRRRALIVFGALGLVWLLLDVHQVVLAITSIAFVLFVFPWHWMERLSQRSGWLILLLFVLAPLGFLLLHGGLTTDPSSSGSMSVSYTSDTSAFSDSAFYSLLYSTVSYIWFLIPLRVILALFQGSFGIRIPIWLKLSTTYVFSTVIPATLMFLLIVLVVYLGIGSLRASLVRDLIQQDLREMERGLTAADSLQTAPRDSLATARYRRVLPRASGVAAVAPNPLKGQASGIEPAPADPSGTTALPESWRMYARLDSLLGAMGPVEIWVKQQQTGSWQLPDTLAPFPGWEYGTRSQSGILPVDSVHSVFAAAKVDENAPSFVNVAMRPLNEQVLEEYKRVVKADITLHPSGVLRMETGGSFSVNMSGDFVGSGRALSTTRDKTDSFWDSALPHGVTELQNWPSREGNNTSTLVGRIEVYSSPRGLLSTLYATEGLNRITVVVALVLSSLFGLALLFSTLLAAGITRTIMKSVKELRHGTERLRRGDLDVQIKHRGNDELGDLSTSFNQMTSDLRRMISEVTVKERLEREIQIARRIQVHLLPAELPQRKSLEVGARSDPAFEVGGDYYDCIDLGERGLLIALGDVSGKGVGAAVLMSNLQASLSLLATQDVPLEEMVRQLNRQVYKNSTPEMFITFFAGLFNPERQTLTYVNAGHDVPVLVRYGKPIDLGDGGMLLGIMEDAVYEAGVVDLQPGDLFAVYSDGLTEAMNETDEEFGRDRLIHCLDENKHLEASRLVNKVLESIRDYAGHERAGRDDLTLLTVRVLED